MKLNALKNKSKLLGERQVVEALNYITWMAGEKKMSEAGRFLSFLWSNLTSFFLKIRVNQTLFLPHRRDRALPDMNCQRFAPVKDDYFLIG